MERCVEVIYLFMPFLSVWISLYAHRKISFRRVPDRTVPSTADTPRANKGAFQACFTALGEIALVSVTMDQSIVNPFQNNLNTTDKVQHWLLRAKRVHIFWD